MTERLPATGASDRILVVDPTDIDPTEPVPGLLVRTPFSIGVRPLDVQSVERRTAWHRREGTVYGWVRAGHGRLEFGPDETDAVSLTAGDFLRIPDGLVHRYVAEDPLELLAVVDGEAGTTRADRPSAADTDGGAAVVGPDGLVPTVGSPNLVREAPFPGGAGEVLMMRVRAAGGAAAGWHHHGGNVYFGYAVDGPSETEYGPGGEDVARIEIGECFHVPPQLIHRDTNPGTEPHTGIVWLCGGEPWVVNVDGPA